MIGGNGTGKTYMMDAFTMKIAKEHPVENITFATHKTSLNPMPLLELDLEVKYKNLSLTNVTVNFFRRLSELANDNLLNEIVCLDEIHLEDVTPDELYAIQARFLWIVVRDTFQSGNHEEYLRQKFPGWEIVNLIYPLRTSKTLSEKVKSGQVNEILHANNFKLSLQIS